MDFNGKTAIVTGAGRGLGLAYARTLADFGANVVISDLGTDRAGAGIDDSVASNAARELQGHGKNVIAHCGDLSKESTCRELVELTINSFGSLDILIHNAGWVGYQAIEEIEVGFIQRAIDVNILATTWICKHAWKYLKQSSAPRIVLTTSDRAMYQQYAQSGLTAYAAGKMAQVGIMNALSMEGLEHKILVNAVSPVAKTRMWGETSTPANLKPEWVTPGVIYLVSDACQDTGFILRASNGQFTATRFEENSRVDYPINLARVKASSAEEIAELWESIKEC
ncbi:SDR family NAD(P)-dependent oxidoreductase [Plectonema cf. radiosum LEGE 06105]|uniref:SDR family NAD(P)-dependent oxidoreductase n=1 Tax=Plectonema cf. radiosum LEGE 06105 TaxID=945769 RepID=A0A8J7EYR9_9CYAN|nr:SDR family NAD(P)-dependent oxidoreductase [Plectonema radiosum]MBE9212293.1 SDR family NAD(P)-dependent oxidoreductase [Plectonema cf. radiosum LEGE 06105]